MCNIFYSFKEQGYLKEPIVPKFIELEKSYKRVCENHQNEEKKLAEANKKEMFTTFEHNLKCEN